MNKGLIKTIAIFEALALIPAFIMSVAYSAMVARDYLLEQHLFGFENASVDFSVDKFFTLWGEGICVGIPYFCVIAVVIVIIAVIVAKRKV